MGKTAEQMKQMVIDWLNRSDLSNVAMDFINMAQDEFERVFNWDHMKVRTTLAMVQNTYLYTNPIPNYKSLSTSDILDTNNVRHPIQRVPFDIAMDKYPDYTGDTGLPVFMSFVTNMETNPITQDIQPVDNILVRPTPDSSSYSIEIWGFQYTPDLDFNTNTNTNWWTQNAWDCLLYGALSESAPYIGDDPRLPVWRAMRDDKLKKLRDAQIQSHLSGNRLSISSDYVV